MNRFSKKFREKSISDLEEIIQNDKTYVEEARVAALEILKEKEKEHALAIQQEILEKKQKEEERKELARKIEIGEVNNVFEEFELEELYSKKAILGFSFFFTTLHGAILLMHNFGKTEKKSDRIVVLVFGLLHFTALIIVNLLYHLPSWLTILLNGLGGWILTGVFWNKYIGENYHYNSKNVLKALAVSLGILVIYSILLIYWDRIVYGY